MEPWGNNQKSTEQAVEPLRQADVSATQGTEPGRAKRWKISAALMAVGSLALVVGGTFHSWRKSAPLPVQGSSIAANKSVIGKFADRVLKGSSLFGGFGSRGAAKLETSKATKMSGAPVSLPLFFEANRGQTDARVKFLARSSGYTLFVTPTETVFAGARTTAPRGLLPTADTAAENGAGQAILRMKLLESNPGPEINGAKELPGKVNYLIGNNPRDWRTGVPLYEEVRSREVYPGIDLVFHGDQQRLEYDFRVAPGADPGRIRFRVTGAEKIAVDENGDLVLKAAKTEFRMRKPVMYQQMGEQRKLVDGGFSLQAGKLVAFRVGAYDNEMPLVIDPTIIFASFIGGAGVEAIGGIDLDVTNPSAPKLFVAGSTTDVTTFTETNTKLGTIPGAGAYAFVAKIDPTTTGAASLDFLTFIGGNLVFTGGTAPCQNFATDIKLDVSGGAGQTEPVLLGQTNCRDFPVTIGGPSSGTDDIFITRLTPSGAAIDGSTLFGGSGSEGLTSGTGGASLFLNPEGTIVLSGQTTSADLPATGNAYSVSLNNGTPGGFDDCFVAKMDRSFNILYLTYLNVGGSSTSGTAATCGVGAIDPAGKIYVGGTIYSATAFNLTNGGTGANGFQKTFVGTPGTTPNTFVAVLDPSQIGVSQMTYVTYIAGGGGTAVRAGAVDLVHGLAVVVGDTLSNSTTNAPNIPLLNAFQSVNNAPAGASAGFITVMDTTKTGAASLLASSYLGGTTAVGGTSIRSVAFDSVPGNPPTQRIVVGGQTTTPSLPTMNPLQASLVGSQNAFVSVFSVPSSGSTFNMSLLFSTYLGGGVTVSSQSESVRALITDSNHAIYALGRTPSANFFGNTSPATTVNGFQTTCASCGGGTPQADLAIFVLTPQSSTNVPDLTVTKSHSGNFSQGQSGAQYSITVTNSGTGATLGTVSLADSLPSSLTATAMSGTGWACSITTLVCTRSDALGAGLSYPVITLTVNVTSTAPPSVTNTVVVSGGSETNTNNDAASDVTTINSVVGACTDTFTGASGGSWGTATNWSTGSVPGVSDVACINSGTTVLLNTGLAAANQTIKGLNSSGTLTITGGPLTATGNSIANVLNVNSGGTLAVNGQFTITGPLGIAGGTLSGTGETDVEGMLTWSSGFICSATSGTSCSAGTNSTINLNGGITFPASASVNLYNRTLNLSGTATWSGANGSMTVYSGAMVNIASGGIWNYVNDSLLQFGGGTAVAFKNGGTFEKTGGTSTTINLPFNNTGTVRGNAGTLVFSGGGACGPYPGSSCTGTYTATAPGAINFTGGVFAHSGPINGTGTVNFNGADMDFGMGTETISTATINLNSGALAGAAPGVIDFTAPLNWTGGFICSALTSSGTSCTTGTNATANANAGINFPSTTSPVVTPSVNLYNRTLNVMGTALWSSTTGAANGTMTLYAGAMINIIPGAIWNYANDSLLQFGGGTAVAVNNGGTFEKTGGTSNSISLPFNNTGTVKGIAGTLVFNGGGACGKYPGSSCDGTYTPTAPGAINFTGGVFAQIGPINGTGTVNFNGADMDFGTGTETISTATINLSGGALAGAAPGILNFSSPLNWTGGFICSALTSNGSSCTTGANATVNANAGINFPSTTSPAITPSVNLYNRTLNVTGTGLWSSTSGAANGSMTLYAGAVINTTAGGVWDYENDSILQFGGGTAVVFNNGGTFKKGAGTGTMNINLPFNNAGTVNGNSGTLSFAGGGTCGTYPGSSCTGAYAAGMGGTISFSGGTFSQTGPISGAGTVNFSGGNIDFGIGTENISTTTVNFSSGILFGASPSVLNISGLFNWSGGEMCSAFSSGSCVSGTNATTHLTGGMNVPSGTPSITNRTFDTDTGMVTVTTTNYLGITGNAIVNNTATWNIAGNSQIYGPAQIGGAGTGTFNNNAGGTFTKSDSTSSTIGVFFGNSGTVNVCTLSAGVCTSSATGTLTFNDVTSSSGAWNSQAGGTLQLSSGSGNTANLTGAFAGGGTVQFGNNAGTLNLSGNYSVTGGTASLGGVTNFNKPGLVSNLGALTISAGTMVFSTGNPVSATTLNESSGILAGTDNLTVNGLTTWTGGEMCTTPVVANNNCTAAAGTQGVTTLKGGMNIPSGTETLDGRTLNTSGGAVTITSSSWLGMTDSAVVNNTATWNVGSGFNFYTSAQIGGNGSGTFNNNSGGSFLKTDSSTSTVYPPFNNNGGVVNVCTVSGNVCTSSGTGTLNLQSVVSAGGTWNSQAGGTLQLSSGSGNTANLTGAFSGGGTVQFGNNTGTLNLTGNYNVTGGTTSLGGVTNFNGPGLVSNLGALTISGGIMVFSTGNPVSATTLTESSGILAGTDNVTVNGLTTWTGGEMCTTPVVANNNCTAAAGTQGITTLKGGINISSGTEILDGRTLNTSGGAVTITSGSWLGMLDSAVVNNTVAWNFGTSFNLYTSAQIGGNGSGTFNNNSGGSFLKTDSSTSTVYPLFNNNGGSVNVCTVSGNVCTTSATGTLNLQSVVSAGGTWNSQAGGTLQLSSGTGNAANLTGAFAGGGTVQFGNNAGTLNLSGNYSVTGGTTSLGGTTKFLAPAVVSNLGALTISNGTMVFSTGNPVSATTLNESSGILAGTDNLTVNGLTTWTGGSMCTTLTAGGQCTAAAGTQGMTTLKGGMNISGGTEILDGRTLNTSGGAVMVTFGSWLGMQDSAVVNNTVAWNIGDSFNFYSAAQIGGTGTGTFNNNGGGVFSKTDASTTSIFVPFNNAGTVSANLGTLSFGGANYTQTAGNTLLNGGIIATTSSNPLLIQGGNLAGSGTVMGDVSNTGDNLTPGTSTTAGAISISGSGLGVYTQGPNGSYSVKLGGTAAGQYDTLSASGAVTLAGPLNVILFNSYTPKVGDSFTILTGASITGTFSTTNLPGGTVWKVTYNPASVVLSVVSVGSPVATLGSTSAAFPNTVVNKSATVQKVQVQNTGTLPLTITSIAVTGADAGNYSYTADAAQPCPISPATLGNGSICMLDIGFTPLTGGTHNSAAVTITDNSGNVTGAQQMITLSGTGITLASIAVTPTPTHIPMGSSLQYDAVATYSDSSQQDVTTTATWASSNMAVATISNTAGSQGQARGVAGGSTFITAMQSGITSNQATLNVTTATHYTVSAPGNAVAGAPINVTTTAVDQFGQIVPGYTGTVHFTSSDGQAVLPANATLSLGQQTFPFTLKTLGNQTITATDTVTPAITGTSNSIAVGSGLATHLSVSAPGIATVGTAINVTVTALDQFNNVVSNYPGTVHLTSSDGTATLPADAKLVNGTGQFQVTLKKSGIQTVTATDTGNAAITGTSNNITVGSGLATHLSVSAPGIATAGIAIQVTVTALDQFGNRVTAFPDMVQITSSDGKSVLPPNATLTNGVGNFSVTFDTTGNQTVTATDTTNVAINGTSGQIAVSPTAATHLSVSAPAVATAGTAISVTVTALDQFNNVVTNYTDTVHFTATDGQATLPADSKLTNGTAVFQVTLKTAGNQTVTATDTSIAGITGTTAAIAVSPAATTHFSVATPPAATSGAPFNVTVKALDSFGNVVTTYPGTVFITSSDGKAVLPPNSTLTNGVGVFAVTLVTAGNKTVTATDTISPIITGTSSLIAVSPGTTTHLSVSAPAAATAGLPFNMSVTALDQFNNVVTNYPGTVHFTSSDGKAVLPPNSTLTSGSGVFAVTLETAGNQTVTATDTSNASINGTTAPIAVSPATTTHLSLAAPAVATSGTPFNITVTALDQFGNQVTSYAGTVHFTSSDLNAVLPADSKLANGTAQFAVTLKTAPIQTITGTDTVTASITGSSNAVTVTAATLKSIAITPVSPSVAKGLTVQLKATGTFSDNSVSDITSQVTWASTAPGVATVSATGLATGVGVGASNITASLNGVTSPIDVLAVTAATLQSIAVTPASPSIAKGLTLQLKATGTYSDNSVQDLTTQVTWGSTAPGVATVSATGLAAAVGAGSTNITASLNGVTSPIDVLTVTAPVLQSIAVTPANPSIVKGTTQQFTATGTYSDASKSDLTSQVTWNSATTGVATINATGLATGVGTGTSNITANLGGVTSPIDVLTVTQAVATFAYVEDKVSANCCLDVFDISTHQLVAAIPMTNFTEPMGITPDQSRVYMADYLNNLVDVVDTTTNTLMTTIPIGNGPNAVAITPNGKFGYVADFDNNVPVFSVATNTAVASVPVGFPTGWVSITPDGAWVYAGSNIDGRVAVINTATNTLSSTITLTAPAGQSAVGCVTGPTFNPAGTLGYFLLLCSGNNLTGNTVDVLSIPSNTPVTTITVGSGPFQAVVTPDGSRLIVVNNSSNNVSVVDTATNAVISTISLSGHPGGIAVTPDGTLAFVSQHSPATVDVINLAANTVTSNIATTKPFAIVIASPPTASAATTLMLTPPNLVFNAQVTGTQSASQTINVKNPGGSPVTLTNVSLTGPNAGDFRLTNGCPTPPAPLGAGLSCNLQISSDPTANGPRTALVTIDSTNGIAASTQSAPLSGAGISLVSIAVTPASTSVTATKTVQFTATGTFSDNSSQDITNSVNWTSSSTGIATINPSGLATGVAAGGPITITATSGNIIGTAQLTVTPLVVTFSLNVTLIGTGTGSVTDNLGSINCVDTAGVITGTCSANYPSGTVVNLTATPTQPSTFGGWLQACSGTAGCSVMMNSAQSVTASFVPPPKMIPVPLAPGTNVSGMATYNCPSNPNPTPANPCLDPNAHATSLTIGQVITPFTLTVVATEVPPTNGDGNCENGRTPGQDLDCRFGSFFTFQNKPNGDRIVPLCDPYANGNCVVYSVFFQKPGQEPDPSMYVGPIDWNITVNNDTFMPPAPYTGSKPQLYYDPSGFVQPNSPYGTDCTTPMLIGNPGVPTNPPIFCQIVFNITTIFNPNKKVDFLIGGKTKVFSDAIVAFPPIFAPVVTVTTTPDAATVTAGNPIGFTITVSNSAAAIANNVSLNTPLPGGTNVNWTISPTYTGAGTCTITGPQGSQVLNCAFGTLNPSTNLSVHIQSAASAAGTAISTSTIAVGSQQILSIGSIVVQPITVTFSGLTASQAIPVGTSSVTVGGVIGNGTQFAPSGETVSVTINGVTQPATVGSNGVFTLQFPTAGIPASATPYPITYSYAGDSLLSKATDSSTTLTVKAGGEPAITAKTIGSGTVNGNFYEDVQLLNTGTGVARRLTINSVTFKTFTGTGSVTLNTTLSPGLPDNLGSLDVGASATVRLYLNVPAGVTLFLMSETGNVSDFPGTIFSYSSAQVVSH